MSAEKTEIETFFGKCRCCLAYGYLKNMWVEHEFEGETEIYGEMLVQCFCLSWDQSDEAMEQDQICEQCIRRLRDASDFKKVVLDSQEELVHQVDEGYDVPIKDEVEEEQLGMVHNQDNEVDKAETTYADTTYADTECTVETLDDESFKDETEYEDIEFLEEDDDGENAGATVVDSDSSQLTENQSRPAKRKKQPIKHDTKDGPKPKWPKRLPKSERFKTYRQYSEEELRLCMKAVRNNELTSHEASLKYNVPQKTISAKIRLDPKDVQIDNTTNSTNKDGSDDYRKKLRKRPTDSGSAVATDKETKINIKFVKKKKAPVGFDETRFKTELEKFRKLRERSTDSGSDVSTDENSKRNIKFVKKRKAPLGIDKTPYETELETSEINDMYKHKNNLKVILQNSNATIIKSYGRDGFTCNFCDKQTEVPSELKEHNLQTHTRAADTAIKAKYVSDLVIKLDITNLKCKVCKKKVDTLEDFMIHLNEKHLILIHKDVKNHIVPFKFDTDGFRCVKCKKNFKIFELLSQHMTEHYRNFVCSVCDLGFINKQALLTHSCRQQKGDFECFHCPEVFETAQRRRAHEQIVHTMVGKYRKCSYCDARFSSWDSVIAHEAKAHRVKPPEYNCEDCGKKYCSQGALIIHRNRCHPKLRRYKCPKCGMAFSNKMELYSHFPTHKIREYKCDICKTIFGTQNGLNQHVKVHFNSEKYLCDYCNRDFLNKTSFKTHMIRRHGEIV